LSPRKIVKKADKSKFNNVLEEDIKRKNIERSVKPMREKLFTTTLKYFKRKENAIDSTGSRSARTDTSKNGQKTLNKYMLDRLAATHSELKSNSRTRSRLSRNTHSKMRWVNTTYSNVEYSILNENVNAHSEISLSKLGCKKFGKINCSNKCAKLNNDSSFTKGKKAHEKKYRSIVNKLFLNEEAQADQQSEFNIDFPIPEFEKESSIYTLESEATGWDFWFIKGKEATKKSAIEAAIDYYLQGLRVDPKHHQTYHNLGCWFVYLDRWVNALKCFEQEYILTPFEIKALYALVIVSLKLGNLDKAIQYIEAAKNLESKDNKLEANLIYFEALCYKLDGNFSKSNECYHKLAKILYIKEKALVVKYTIGLLLIPMLDDRMKVINFVENLRDIMDLYTVPQDPDQISKYYDYENNIWDLSFESWIVKKLSKYNFFNRFSIEQLEFMLRIIKLKKFQTDDVLFTENKKVYILLHGDVVLKGFKFDTFPNKLLHLYKKGWIIGSQFDKEANSYENWAVARIETTVVEIDSEIFPKIWKLQNTIEKIKFLPYLQWWNLFRLRKEFPGLNVCKDNFPSALTINRLYELMEKRVYRAGSLILPQSKKSPVNLDYKIYFDLFEK
jgi:tetratricopeptide (TPR) repeat protein